MSLIQSIADLSLLLVEPSTMQERAIRTHLEELGATIIHTVRSGTEAFTAMRAAAPSVVISALYLPDMTGADMVFSMRNQPEFVLTPFILVSSETRVQVLDTIRQSGACSLLPKPFTTDQMERALMSAIETLDPPLHGDAIPNPEDIRILLVDDSDMVRHYLRHLLESVGIEHILEAKNGKEATMLLAGHMVDLVMTDYNMPEMDGAQLTKFIRQQSWQRSVPILMITSEHNQSRLAAVEQAGVSAICDKPMEPAEIWALIAKLLAQ
ncbi:MAG: response regulator [Rhodocyclaceae bacterium]|nr:response regulator [Rhodocyclaceae bacterium]